MCVQGEKLHKRTGTPLYMAPELFMQYYGLESDIWALGILLYQASHAESCSCVPLRHIQTSTPSAENPAASLLCFVLWMPTRH